MYYLTCILLASSEVSMVQFKGGEGFEVRENEKVS